MKEKELQQEILTQAVVPNTIAEAPNPSVIQIGTLQAFLGVAVILIGTGIAWGIMKKGLSVVEKLLVDTVVPKLTSVSERLVAVETKVSALWKDELAPANSPRKLNPRGEDVLNNSGIKEVIDENLDKLVSVITEQSPTNAYDAEMLVLNTVNNLETHCPDKIEQLKNGAYKTGVDISGVLFVGGIYLRDKVFPKLDLSIDDIDNHKT